MADILSFWEEQCAKELWHEVGIAVFDNKKVHTTIS
jgi:hypothetical protein